jgi:glutaredoxin
VSAARGRSSADQGSEPGGSQHKITLLSRPGCHLCDDARAVIARVASDLGVPFDERDITASADDLAQYSEMIPVTFVDGVQHDFWRVSEDRLRAVLLA